jgi:hypothetical protein
MKNTHSLKILKNLHSVLELAKSRYQREYVPQDVVLTAQFQEDFRRCILKSTTNQIEYLQHTTILRNKNGQVTYIPNQWFVVASYFVDFCTELLTYQRFFLEICKRKCLSKPQMNEYALTLRSMPTQFEKDEFMLLALEICKEKFPHYENEYPQVVNYLWRFVSDYSWWAGSKAIDRGDLYVSPLLSMLNLVAASSSFAAEIVNLYATDLELRVEVDDPRNFAVGLRVNEGIPYTEEESNEEYVETLPIESEPQKRIKISISAASLERFHSNL